MDPSPPVAGSKGIWIIDSEAKTVYANAVMAAILGTTPVILSGRHSFQYVFEEDLPAAQRLFAQKEAGGSAPFHFRLRREDGSSIWVHVQGTPMYLEGRFNGIVGTFTVSDQQGTSS